MIQVYLPTSAYPDEEVQAVYTLIENIKSTILPKDIVILNAKVDNTDDDNDIQNMVWNYGLGDKNEHEDTIRKRIQCSSIMFTACQFGRYHLKNI